MRLVSGALVAALVGCGGAASPSTTAVPRDLDLAATPAARAPRVQRATVDPILGLGDPSDTSTMTWVTPAQARLEIAASPIEVPALDAAAVPTSILDEQGGLVRVAVRLPHARFSLWTDRKWLFSIVQSEVRMRIANFPSHDEIGARLRPGARVRVVAKGEARSQVQYLGDVELTGWVPDTAIGTEGPPPGPRYHMPVRKKMLHVARGAVIRSEPKFSGEQIAVVSTAFTLDGVNTLPGNWYEVVYADSDVMVRGYYQHPSPPTRTSKTRLDPDDAPLPLVPNTQLAARTCLYTRARGEAVGYLVEDQPAFVEPTQDPAWWSVGVPSPWGPILFTAHGPDTANLEACMPTSP